MKKLFLSLLMVAGFALANNICSAAPGAPGVPASLIQCCYSELDHFHGGYEINLHFVGTGTWELYSVNQNGEVLVGIGRHNSPHQRGSWAWWCPEDCSTRFFLVLSDMSGHHISITELGCTIDTNPF